VRRLKRHDLLRVFLLLLLVVPAAAQERHPPTEKEKELAEFIKANYTKHEYMVRMRDGVRLFTSVYVPKDASATNTYPILFDRTPYSVAPYGTEN
jgi:uncharacterized protein